MKLRWDVDDNTVVAARLGGFRSNRLTVNDQEIPAKISLRKANAFSFNLADGRHAVLSVKPQYLAGQPFIELHVDGRLMVPTEKKPVLCDACGKPVKPNDQFCGACGHAMPPPEHYTHKRHVKSATSAIWWLAVLFAMAGPLFFFIQKERGEALLAKYPGLAPDDTYPDTLDGVTYTLSELNSQLQWESYSVLAVNLIVAAIMAGLAVWGRRAPLAAVLIATATYVVLIVANAIVDPKTIAQGLIVKIIIISFLARGIKSALALRSEHD